MLAYVSAKKKILQHIKTENLQAGDQLPTELELSEQLDISRLTLREAMNAVDRKIVHDTVNEVDGVATISEGVDPDRRVVIVPASE